MNTFPENIYKSTALIYENDRFISSGIIFLLDDKPFAITAGHSIYGKDFSMEIPIKQLIIKQDGKSPGFTVRKIYGNIELAKKHDITLLELNGSDTTKDLIALVFYNPPKDQSQPLMFRGKYRSATDINNWFDGIKFDEKVNDDELKYKIKCPKEIFIDSNGLAGPEWLEGISGSGIFYCNADFLACAGIVIEIKDKGDTGKILCASFESFQRIFKDFKLRDSSSFGEPIKSYKQNYKPNHVIGKQSKTETEVELIMELSTIFTSNKSDNNAKDQINAFFKMNEVFDLNLSTMFELLQIFQNNKWAIDLLDEDSLYRKFCEMLKNFNLEQQNLILELTTNYLNINFTDYQKYMNVLLNEIISKYPDYKELYIIPVLRQNDLVNGNASNSSIYLALSFIKIHLESLEEKYNLKLVVRDNVDILLKSLPTDIKGSNRIALCFVDEFIGSGETALSAVNYLSGLIDFGDNLFILSFVGQVSGVKKLTANGIKVIVAKEREKGITDSFSPEIVKDKIDIMQTIEALINAEPDFSFGYKRTEALISFEQTPKSTFPLFWFKNEINGKKYKPPFTK